MENIKDFLKHLPELPGIYKMLDINKNVIYIGKAKNLKKRIPSYFKENLDRNNQIKKMVTLIDNIEIIVTNNEIEALILENNLIKEFKPKYNTLLKDDKTYPYLEITLGDDFPRILLSRNNNNKESKYFGPFPDINSVKNILDLINKIYKTRTCEQINLPKKECLYYHIGKCNAPCINKISKEDYLKEVENIIDFLKGNYISIKKELEKEMINFSNNMEFEKAAEKRDLINNIEEIFKKQIINRNKDDKDILAIKSNDKETIVVLFIVRDGKVINKKDFYLENLEDKSESFLLSKFIERYYSSKTIIPKEIYLNLEIENKDLIEKWLKTISGYKVITKVPLKGDTFKLIELATKNASLILNENERKRKIKEDIKIRGIKELEKLLELENLKRLESFDISHLSGTLTVGSMIVYENFIFNKKGYRKFKLEDINNDLESIKTVLKRRFLDEKLKEIVPSLLLIDGGKEQVKQIESLLEEMNIRIPVCGMVKNDKHKTNHLFYNNKEILFEKNENAYKLIEQIQDETHEFAINYNKLLRTKNLEKSILDDIPGIGTKRKQILLKEFKSIEDIKNKNIEELTAIKGIDKKTAENIFKFFKKEE